MSAEGRGGSCVYEWGGGGSECASPDCRAPTRGPAPANESANVCRERQMWSLDDFDVGRKLGEGRFGKIYLAREKETKCAVVLKCLSKDMIRYHGLAHQLRREVELHEYTGRYHHNVLRLFAYFWDDVRVFLVLEYADGGSLQTLLDSRPRHCLQEEEARSILRQLLSALAFLHERDIIHRDVKPDNILIKGEAQEIKLADFSWAVRLDCRAPYHCRRRHTLCGTLDYLAPEQILKRGCTTKADVWALGVLTYRMLCGRLPFEDLASWEVCARIAKGDVRYPSHLSKEARDFIEALLCVDESERLSCAEALRHAFIQSNGRCNVDEATVDKVVLERSDLDFDCSSIAPKSWDTHHVRFLQPMCTTASSAPTVPGAMYAKTPDVQSTKKQEFNETTTTNNNITCKWPMTAPCSNSISAGSFVSVSSSRSTECIFSSMHNVSTPGISIVAPQREWISSLRTTANCATSKSYSDDVGMSSQGVSFSRPSHHRYTSDRSGMTAMHLGHSPALSPIMVPGADEYDDYGAVHNDLGSPTDESVADCVLQLRFDDSLASLSQLTTASTTTVETVENCQAGWKKESASALFARIS